LVLSGSSTAGALVASTGSRYDALFELLGLGGIGKGLRLASSGHYEQRFS
jgi:hypothetical protein